MSRTTNQCFVINYCIKKTIFIILVVYTLMTFFTVVELHRFINFKNFKERAVLNSMIVHYISRLTSLYIFTAQKNITPKEIKMYKTNNCFDVFRKTLTICIPNISKGYSSLYVEQMYTFVTISIAVNLKNRYTRVK